MRRRTTPPAAWMTERNLALARALWDEGVTTTEIARRCGTTKNGVLGVAHRRNWPPRPSPIGVRKGEVWQAREAPPRKAEQPHRSRNAPPTRKLPKRDPDALREPCRPQPLAAPTLSFAACQWPTTSQRPWAFCGAPVADGGAWCQLHHAIVYTRPPRWDRLGVAA